MWTGTIPSEINREFRKRHGLPYESDEQLAQQRRLDLVGVELVEPRPASVRASGIGGRRVPEPVMPAGHPRCPPRLARDCDICNPALAAERGRGPVSKARQQNAAYRERVQREHQERAKQAMQGLGPARPGSYEAHVEADQSQLIVEAEVRGVRLDEGTALRIAGQRQASRRRREYDRYRDDVANV